MTDTDISKPFDRSGEYEEMLNQGLRLSGEGKTYFLEGRLQDLRARLPLNFGPKRICDYGCGMGDAAPRLAQLFAHAHVVGVDTAQGALDFAQQNHASERVSFAPLSEMAEHGPFDLVYCNGVFHHIEPGRRAAALSAIHTAMAPGGFFAMYENNPYNPGARMVMARIPFDRDAVMLSAREASKSMQTAGLRVQGASFLFYFPRPLKFLRFSEAWLRWLPLGAQYGVLARR